MNHQLGTFPCDEHDRRLIENVRPPDWSNPQPAERYNLVVLGAGTAGLVAAAGAAGLGAKVALVERDLMGGDCLNVGCVPSKTLIRAGRAVAEVEGCPRFGVTVPGAATVDFGTVMDRVRRVRAAISPHDSARRFRDEYGVDVFLGAGKFCRSDAVEVDGTILRFERAVIATGAGPGVPLIPGLAEVNALTNETIFNLSELPARLAVVGGGPVGCELAQAFSRLGSAVTLIEMAETLLPRESAAASAVIRKVFEREGVEVRTGTVLESVLPNGSAGRLRLASGGGCEELEVDAILVAVGRQPNVDGLGLETAGVRFGPRGVEVDDHLRTTNRRIYAAGDVCSHHRFTHAADFMARTVIQNAFFGFAGRKKASSLTIPRATFTDPEVAGVGLSAEDAARRGLEIATFTVPMGDVDRAVAEGHDDGFVEIHVKKGSDTIVGAAVVAKHAGEMISEITTAMIGGMGLGTLASVIHPYPTWSEAIRKAGDLFNRTRLTDFRSAMLRRFFAWRRREWGSGAQ